MNYWKQYHEQKPTAPTAEEKLDGFIYQTAQDYALPYHTVKNVIDIHGRENMYDELEGILRDNRNANTDPNEPKQ